MQPRLMRSRNEKMLGGVCGGLGEYFVIDPVIVRLVFVLVTLTTGIGIVLYPILWAIMPKAPLGMPSIWGQPPQIGTSEQDVFQVQQPHYVRQEAKWGGQSSARTGATGAPSYRYDPMTGEPVGEQQAVPPAQSYAAPRRSWRFIGITVLAIGLMAAGNIFGFTADLLFPILLIAIGALLLRRR